MGPKMESGSKREVEIKLRLTDAAEGRRRLRQAGFRVTKRRAFEQNVVFDTSGRSLRRRGLLLRLRTAGRRNLVTFKGPAIRGKHKIRKEIEAHVDVRSAFLEILDGLGFRPAFRYEKYRTEYRDGPGAGRAMLDETPAGTFLELEGSPRWIDRAARRLGFTEAGYITATYAELHRATAGRRRRDMLFPPGFISKG
jgi:adenylate cyclase class 2